MTHDFCLKLNNTFNERGAALKFRIASMIGILMFLAFMPITLHAAEEKPEVKQQYSSEKDGTGGKGNVVARVNGFEITQEALKAKMMRMIGTRQSGIAGGDVDPEALRKEALDKLIVRELALQRAKAEGYKVGKDELDNAISEIKAKVGEEKYREALEKSALTEEGLRDELEKNLLVKHIFEKEVASLITISEVEVKKEYEDIKDEFSKPEKVLVADFVMFLNMDDKSAPDKAAELIRKIRSYPGEKILDFPSDGTFIVREMELDKNKQAKLYEEAKKLSEGEVSGLIKTKDSFHILKLLKYSPEVKADFSQIRGYLEKRVRGRAQQKKMAEWEVELKKNARIEIFETPDTGKNDEKR